MEWPEVRGIMAMSHRARPWRSRYAHRKGDDRSRSRFGGAVMTKIVVWGEIDENRHQLHLLQDRCWAAPDAPSSPCFREIDSCASSKCNGPNASGPTDLASGCADIRSRI